MTMLEHDDHPTAERVRAALRQIATDDLRDVGAPSAMRSRPGRRWVRPATLVAALVLVAGIVVTVVVLRPDPDRTVVVDGGAAPVRLIPGPLPADIRLDAVTDLDHLHVLDRTIDAVPQRSWVRMEQGRIVAMLNLRLGEPSTPSAGGGWTYTTSRGSCGPVTLSALNVSQDELFAAGGTISCAERDGRPLADAQPPAGFESIAPDAVLPQQWTIFSFGGDRAATLDYSTYFPPIDVTAIYADAESLLAVDPDNAWRREQIGEHDVLVTKDRDEYRWEAVEDVWVDLTRGDLTEVEVAALIAGTRVVSEAEWQAWVDSADPTAEPGANATIVIPAATVGPTSAPGR